MLPAHLAENIRKQVLYYLQSTFDFREKPVEKAFERFLTDPENGLFKGPWVQYLLYSKALERLHHIRQKNKQSVDTVQSTPDLKIPRLKRLRA